VRIATAQYDAANNMTDRAAALGALLAGAAAGATDAAERALGDFYRRFENEALVIDKWFAMQAAQRGTPARPTLAQVRNLMAHPAFNLKNPNRARSLIFSFCAANPAQFHAADGSGYAFWAEQVLALDAINPQVAARLARSLERGAASRRRCATGCAKRWSRSRPARNRATCARSSRRRSHNARDASPAAATKPAPPRCGAGFLSAPHRPGSAGPPQARRVHVTGRKRRRRDGRAG
jgi:hypothetical protein